MAYSSRSKKQCYYEVLGISNESSPDEIRSSYLRLASQLHPDKSLLEAEATAQFQKFVHAYEVLADPKERALYDSYRSHRILSKNALACGWKSGEFPGGSVPDLKAFFSTAVFFGFSDNIRDGFYRVYFNVFKSVYLNEIKFARSLGLRLDSVKEALSLGNLKSPYSQVRAFYKYWLGFCTLMDFSWVDEKLRMKSKREYNETVRGLAEFVQKNDMRLTHKMDKYKEEERERKMKVIKEILMERAMNYEEAAPLEEGGDDDNDDDATRKNEELYCIVCRKKFRSEKQWKNHKQSKKHKEKVADFIASFSDIEDEKGVEEISGPLEPSETVEQLREKLQDGLNIDDEEEVVGGGDEIYIAEEDVEGFSEDEDLDDETSLLKKMVSILKSKRKNVVSRKERNKHNTGGKGMKDAASKAVEDSKKDEAGEMEYDNRKSSGRRRRNKNSEDKNNLGDMEESDSGKKYDRSMKTKGRSKQTSSTKCDRCGKEFESRTKLYKHLTDSGHATLKNRRSICSFLKRS